MEDSTVTVLITKDRFRTLQSGQFVEENFSGSLPAFIAAFTSGKKLKPEELTQIRQLLDSYEETK
jgi:predicted transcriptional regulator